MKIVSWQSVLTDHQSHTLRALQAISDVELLVISGVKILSARKEQGWREPDLSGLDVHYLPKSGWWNYGKEILLHHSDAIHLFNGMWADRRFLFLLFYAQRQGFDTGLVTEPYADEAAGLLSDEHKLVSRVKAILRPQIYQLLGGVLARRMQAVFSISEKAVDQFANMGVPQTKIYPFGYFVPFVANTSEKKKDDTSLPRVVFVGGLLKRKGIHILRDALDWMEHKHSMTVDVYGPGDTTVIKGSKLKYRGVIPFGEAQKVIANYDLLLLPSLFDGWGVVVNEALMQGVPVIVSDQVGAKILVHNSGAGAVVPAGDAEALATQLIAILESPALLASWKAGAKTAIEQLAPNVAANYMHEVLKKNGSDHVSGSCQPLVSIMIVQTLRTFYS